MPIRKTHVILRSTKDVKLPKEHELQLVRFLGYARGGTCRVQLPNDKVIVISTIHIQGA